MVFRTVYDLEALGLQFPVGDVVDRQCHVRVLYATAPHVSGASKEVDILQIGSKAFSNFIVQLRYEVLTEVASTW